MKLDEVLEKILENKKAGVLTLEVIDEGHAELFLMFPEDMRMYMTEEIITKFEKRMEEALMGLRKDIKDEELRTSAKGTLYEDKNYS